MKFRIFISGPITGTDDYLDRFEKAENKLKTLGYDVVNPAQHCEKMPKTSTHEEYMAECLPLLEKCDGIYMLHGYHKSEGAKEELSKAVKLGLTVMFEL